MATFAVVLIALGGLMCLLNWGTLVATIWTKRSVSAVPPVGAVLLGTGLALLPELRPFAWLALLADWGALVFILALPRIAHEIWSTSRINLLYRFETEGGGRRVTIKLFRHKIATINAEFNPPIPCNDRGARVVSFGKSGRWEPTESGFSINGYAYDRQLLVSKQDGDYATIELNYPSDELFKYDCLDGLTVREQN